MTKRKLAVIVLAAGQGTRMKSDLPKVLHCLAEKPMLSHVLDGVETLSPDRIVVVVGPDALAVEKVAAPHKTVVQVDRLGTGHAVKQAFDALDGFCGSDDQADIMVIFGDTPLIRPETYQAMRAQRCEENGPKLIGLAFRPEEAGRYGRVKQDSDGRVMGIIEHADATDEERAIDLCNAGILLGEGPTVHRLINQLDNNNAQGEYYLPVIFDFAYAEGLDTRAVEASEEEVMGVNSRQELAVAEGVLQQRLRAKAMAQGVTLMDPDTTWLSTDTEFGRDIIIEPSVFIGPKVSIADNCHIKAFSHIEGAEIGAEAAIGPYARLRPGTVIGKGGKVGNFVETKNAVLGEGAKANHLSYIGDAEVGAKANIGAGTITCNYDGFNKWKTSIGAGAFIGSNTALVAPVDIGAGAIVGAGSTITKSVADDAMAVVRGRLIDKAGAGASFRASRKKIKEEKKG
ncbi:bifunctional N-acetylglucosamine-1-phosphate uridyltransferase/glucosamine-1-phosphate acetyltransferase [Kiloniella spongiae]|uniref:Bifunctional protein GlmU n=1 Tax=Kiloniella spongiae TaxID=1489064 RepID=A0A0H2MA73_9PROT|nr:bifunctional UDP-N-acetylglucosamine diphosphorylase/glucosamine-1-phosphate N-acetyltransferase GlmU [Kiloniella spongiae]KLN59253.1 bifunctional N-acetylglucosamine-1-phosphate uridyltransferase/glucosamine-1-phosphate acetyltransferase [Kiloniella spongiae]